MYMARVLQQGHILDITGRGPQVLDILIGGLVCPGHYLHTRCSGSLRLLHFEAVVLCKIDADALQEYLSRAPIGITAKIYSSRGEDVELGFGKRVLDVYEELPHVTNMTLGSLVLSRVTLPPQKELTHRLATGMDFLRSFGPSNVHTASLSQGKNGKRLAMGRNGAARSRTGSRQSITSSDSGLAATR